jgi:O-antigen/teichoic acid export membrane protein
MRPDRAPFLRLRRAAVLAMAVLGLVVLAAIPLRHVLLDVLFPRYTAFAPLVAPLALQVVVGGFGVPFAASLRGMRRGRELFVTQVFTAAGLVLGAVVGLALGGVLGLAWGMAAGAVGSVAVEIVVAVRARPRPVESSDVVGLEPSEVVS